MTVRLNELQRIAAGQILAGAEGAHVTSIKVDGKPVTDMGAVLESYQAQKFAEAGPAAQKFDAVAEKAAMMRVDSKAFFIVINSIVIRKKWLIAKPFACY